MTPDPKPAPRIRNPVALARARLLWDECAACGAPPANGHHVLPKGSPWFGDDVEANIVMVCGTGTFRCHGALHGNPYVAHSGQRWTQNEVRAAVGAFILAHRDDTVEYVLTKLGWTAGRQYLRTHYFALLPDDYANPA